MADFSGSPSDFRFVPTDELSHKDIFLRLGDIQGQLEFIRLMLETKRAELEAVKVRQTETEKRIAVGMFMVVTLGVFAPIIGAYAVSKMTIGLSDAEIHLIRKELDYLGQHPRPHDDTKHDLR